MTNFPDEFAVLPHSIEAEQSLLGACLLWNTSLSLSPDDFYRQSHGEICRVIQELHSMGQPADLVTVCDYLSKLDKLEQVGGASYVAALVGAAGSDDNYEAYQSIIREKSVIRKLLTICRRAYSDYESDKSKSTKEWINDFIHRLTKLTEIQTDTCRSVSTNLKEVIKDIETRRGRQNYLIGLPTGLVSLDRQTAGFCPGDLIIIAGRPGMGKSALAMNMAFSMANDGNKVLYFGLEMTHVQSQQRILAFKAKVNLKSLRTGNISEKQFAEVLTVAGELGNIPLWIDEAASLTELDIKYRTKRMNPDIVFIDYLGLMKGSRNYGNKRHLEIADITHSMKSLGKELHIPVVVLCQLNRNLENRTNKRPLLSDLRESGDIEQDADVVCFIYRDEVYDSRSKDMGIAELILAKQRNGPTGTVKVMFDPATTMFADLTRVVY